MHLLLSVEIIYHPRRDKSIPVNPLSIYPEDMGVFRKVSFTPTPAVLLKKVDGLTKEDLFAACPGLADFADRGFSDKVIVSFNPVISVSVQNVSDDSSSLSDCIQRHLADTSLKPWVVVMANFLRVKAVAIYYIDEGQTNPDDIEATYRKVDEDITDDIHCCHFTPVIDVFVDDYVNRSEGVIEITPNQVVREVTGLRDFIARLLSNKRILDIGVAYESRLTTRGLKRNTQGV